MTEMDDGKAVFVVLLDLSATFNTFDHQILLDRLSSTFNLLVWRLSGFHPTSVVDISVFLLVVIFLRRMRLMGPMIPRVLAPTSLGLNLEFRKDRSSDHFSLFYIWAALVTLFGNIVLTFTYMLMIFSFTWRLILKLMVLRN